MRTRRRKNKTKTEKEGIEEVSTSAAVATRAGGDGGTERGWAARADVRSTSTTTTAPPHRRRCLAPAARRRRLAQRVAASPARRPTPQQPRRLPSHTAPTPHHRAPSHPDRLPMINVPTKNTQLFLQPLHPATPMLHRGPPPPRSSRPRATGTAATARAATRSATTQPPIRMFERKTLSQASEATFSASPKNLRERDHIRPRQPALTTPQTPHLPSRTFLTTICSRGPYGR